MEPAKLETSIGTLYVRAEARDRFTIEGPYENPWAGVLRPDNAYPHVNLTFENPGDGWASVRTAYEYRAAPIDDDARIPQALLDELSKLGTEWAAANPGEFAKSARAEFDDMILEIVDETFDEITRICSDATKRFRRILGEPEFANHASTPLRRRVQKEAQRLRVMRLQVSGAAKAISTLAGRRSFRHRESTGRSITIVNLRGGKSR